MENNEGVVAESVLEAKVEPKQIMDLSEKVLIDSQIEVAKKYPRNLTNVMANVLFLSTQDKDIADSCFYAVVKNNEIIRGASIRLAEIIVNCYGNLRSWAKVTGNDGKIITAQGVCWDLENNVAFSVEVKRRITDINGRTISAGLQLVIGNKCCSIALRNAIFKVIPLVLTSKIQEKIKKVILGNEVDFSTTKKLAIHYFVRLGIDEKRVLATIGKKTIDELTQDDVVDLRGIATAIKDGDQTIDEAFVVMQKPNAISRASKSLSEPPPMPEQKDNATQPAELRIATLEPIAEIKEPKPMLVVKWQHKKYRNFLTNKLHAVKRIQDDFIKFCKKLALNDVYYLVTKGDKYNTIDQLNFQQVLCDEGWVVLLSSQDFQKTKKKK